MGTQTTDGRNVEGGSAKAVYLVNLAFELLANKIQNGLNIIAGEFHLGSVGGDTVLVSGNTTLPAGTPTYTAGDLVANSATANLVVPITLTLGRLASGTGATGMIRRVRLRKSGTSITNAQFRIHLYRVSPTPSNGDDGAWLTNQNANYVGALDVTMDRVFTDGASGNGVPIVGNEINFAQQTYYALIQALASYTRVANEIFTIECETLRN